MVKQRKHRGGRKKRERIEYLRALRRSVFTTTWDQLKSTPATSVSRAEIEEAPEKPFSTDPPSTIDSGRSPSISPPRTPDIGDCVASGAEGIQLPSEVLLEPFSLINTPVNLGQDKVAEDFTSYTRAEQTPESSFTPEIIDLTDDLSQHPFVDEAYETIITQPSHDPIIDSHFVRLERIYRISVGTSEHNIINIAEYADEITPEEFSF